VDTTYKFKAWQYLNLLMEPSLATIFLLVLFLVASRKNLPPRIFWIELKQSTQWKFVEKVVWKTIDEMHEKNYRKYYRRSFESFNNNSYLSSYGQNIQFWTLWTLLF
jgi:hypothetical protein